MLDTSPGSPGWYLKRLNGKLIEKRPHYQRLDDHYTGNVVIPALAVKAVRESFRRLMQMAKTNYAELVVEALAERTNPMGFRTGADGDDLDDKIAWGMWQANSLDADFGLVTRACYSMGDAYMMVGDVDPELGVPVITPEDPRQVIAEFDPVRRRKAVDGLKVFCEDDDEVAYLFLPGEVLKYRRHADPNMDPIVGWELDADVIELDDPTLIPIIRFANRPDMYGCSRGEFEPHLGLLNRINFQILQRLEIATLQAFKQRAVKGVPNVDRDGNAIDYDDIFSADPGAMWILPATAEVWESGAVDLGPIRMSVQDDVQALAAVTRTPLFYLTADAANGSAEGASLSRESLIFKAKDRLVQLGESVEQTMSTAFLSAGDTVRANRSDMQVIWTPPERYSLTEKYNAAALAQSAGVPWRTIMLTILQYSPQEVERMEQERATDALLAPPPSVLNAVAA